jgi:hypothetical protein
VIEYTEESVSPFVRRIFISKPKQRVWAVVLDGAVRNGFETAMNHIPGMSTTQACFMKMCWLTSLKHVLGVDHVMSHTEWETYLRSTNERWEDDDKEG